MNIATVFEQGNSVLIAVFLLLAAMSLASWYIIFWKAWNTRTQRRLLAMFRKQYVTSPDWPRHAVLGRIDGSVQWLFDEAESLKPILASYTFPERKEILAMHLVQALDRVRTELDKGLAVLASVGSCGPFIGLFGTVWGIYGALMKIAAEGNAGLSVVAGPMGEALVATAAGLFAAIPAVLAYNFFVRGNRLLVQDLRHIAEQMTLYLSLAPTERHQSETVKLVREGH